MEAAGWGDDLDKADLPPIKSERKAPKKERAPPKLQATKVSGGFDDDEFDE